MKIIARKEVDLVKASKPFGIELDSELFKVGYGSLMAQMTVERGRLITALQKIAKSQTMIGSRRIAKDVLKEVE